jgi:sugar phosphate isomerase/epimerase
VKIGLVCWSLSQRMNLGLVRNGFDLVDAAAELGAEGIGIDDAFLPAVGDEEEIQRLRKYADEAGIQITAGAASVDAIVDAVRSDDADGLFHRAKVLGSDVLKATFAGPGVRSEEAWDVATAKERVRQAIAALREIEPVARRNDLPVAVENHIDFTNAELFEIWGSVQSPYVGLLFDTANQYALLEDGTALGEQLIDRVLSVHFKDGYAVSADHGVDIIWCEPGTGLANARATAELLATKPDLTINVETIVTQQWPVPYETTAFWSSLDFEAPSRSAIIARMEEQASEDLPRPPAGDQELLAFETEQLRRSLAAARALFAAASGAHERIDAK